MPPIQIALWTILGVALLISVVTDVRGGRILDVVTYPAIAAGLGVRLGFEGLGDSERGLISGVIAALGALAFFALLAWRKKMGWGDVKLMGAVGAALGFPLTVAALLFISLAGAGQAAVTLIWRGVRPSKQQGSAAARHIPYGVAIALGCAWAMWWEAA